MSDPLNGRQLAEASHVICRAQDPEQAGLSLGSIESAVMAAGVAIKGTNPRQILGTALNNSQDLFQWVEGGRWKWTEPVQQVGAGLSGVALAEEAYFLAMRHDPGQAGLHYGTVRQLLIANGVIIKGLKNPGKTVYTAMFQAKQWFDWVSSGTFRWK